MSPRKKSMLDAFHTSSTPVDQGAAPPPPRPASPPPRRPSPPRAKPARPEPARSEPNSGGLELARRVSAGERGPVFVLGALVGVIALAGAFWLGRASVGAETVLAAPGPQDTVPRTSSSGWELDTLGERDRPRGTERATPAASPAVEEPTRVPDEVDAQGRTKEDRAFYDLENRFTVRAISYANTSNGWQHALTVYRYLREQGLPAIAPIDQGVEIVICVGAEPRREGRLAELRQRLEDLPGPPPRSERGAFSGAFYDNIDHLIERSR